MKSILSEQQLAITIKRLAHQILESSTDHSNTVLIGLQPRGIFLSDQIVASIHHEFPGIAIPYGKLDITFYRDDIRKELHVANRTDIPFSIEGKKVVLIDDVLYTGRTVRASLDAVLKHARPKKIGLATLVDRGHRELPIRADFVGKNIPTARHEDVEVFVDEIDEQNAVIIK